MPYMLSGIALRYLTQIIRTFNVYSYLSNDRRIKTNIFQVTNIAFFVLVLLSMDHITVIILNIGPPEIIAVIILKFKQGGFSI